MITTEISKNQDNSRTREVSLYSGEEGGDKSIRKDIMIRTKYVVTGSEC